MARTERYIPSHEQLGKHIRAEFNDPERSIFGLRGEKRGYVQILGGDKTYLLQKNYQEKGPMEMTVTWPETIPKPGSLDGDIVQWTERSSIKGLSSINEEILKKLVEHVEYLSHNNLSIDQDSVSTAIRFLWASQEELVSMQAAGLPIRLTEQDL